MEEFEVTYEIPCRLVVRAKSEENAMRIAEENVGEPFGEPVPLDDGQEGIVDADVGEARDFRVVKVVVQNHGEVKA
jgi:hypothetical protein